MSDSNTPVPTFSHEKVETSNFLMIVLILLVVAIGVSAYRWVGRLTWRRRTSQSGSP